MGLFAAVALLAGCASPTSSDGAASGGGESESASETAPAPDSETADETTQAETCDWDSPRLMGAAAAPAGQDGELSGVLVGAWQHTHTDDGYGFTEVVNDHRFVFPAADRMLYCQHVPGATEYAENAANVTLNGTTIELPGGYSYTVTAWGEDTMLWNNPVGGGFDYILQRR